MTTTLEAVYEGGVLKLPVRLPLPEKAHVRVTIRTETEEVDEERTGWLLLSEEALTKTWANFDDDVFNELLKG